MNKTVVLLVAFLMAFGLAAGPATAGSFMYSRSTNVTWASAQVSMFSKSLNYMEAVGTVTDKNPNDGVCAIVRAVHPTAGHTAYLGQSCGGTKSFLRTVDLPKTWSITRVYYGTRYSTLR